MSVVVEAFVMPGVVSDECIVCEQVVLEGDDESTYCGTAHQDCLGDHLRECAVCDEDGEFHNN